MRIFSFLGLLFIMCSLAFANSNDPSTIPLQSTYGSTAERYRVLGDFNCDGIEDMALSDDVMSFGNAGGNFDIYFRDDKGILIKYDSVFFHPLAVAVEKFEKNVRLWVYHRYGGRTGDIGYYEVKKEGLSEYKKITIHPGDGGTKMGNDIAEAVFKNSAVEFRVEKSKTVNGKVTWTKY